MSYDINIVSKDTGEVLTGVHHDLGGGTRCVGGTDEAWLNVTYNYSGHFKRVLGDEGIRVLYGMSSHDSIPLLLDAAAKLGDDVSSDYWASTEGNAKQALLSLGMLAIKFPDGIWKGD